MISAAGKEDRLGTTPYEIFNALQRFRPGDHRCVELRWCGFDATAWPRRYADNALGTACLRVTHGGETRWLGRLASAEPFAVDGQQMPSVVEVPVTWVSSVLQVLVSADDWPADFPWYGGSPLAPLHVWSGDAYAFRLLEAAWPWTRRKHLASLRGELLDLMTDGPQHEMAMAKALAELRRVGHDLWSLDYDEVVEYWGGDYMRPAEGQGLWLWIPHEDPSWFDLGWGAPPRRC